LSFVLTIQGLIAGSFVAALILGLIFSGRWKLAGCGLPILVGAAVAVWLTNLTVHHSTESLEIPFSAFWSFLGAFPGAALGSWLHRRFSRSA
jgi:hypothetical protein